MSARQVFWGVVLIFLGLVFLGHSMGMALPAIWAWWPVLIIALGLDMTYAAAQNKRKGKKGSYALAFTVLFIGVAALGSSISNWAWISVIGASMLGYGAGMIVDAVSSEK